MPRPLSYHPHAAVGQQRHLDVVAVPGHGLVYGVVHDLLDQVMQAALASRPDVHSGSLTDSFQALQNLDRTGIVGQTELHPASEARSPAPLDVAVVALNSFYLLVPTARAVLAPSRTCRAARGRPGTRQPPRCRGGAGPRTLTRRTVPSPSSALSRRTSCGASSRTWVAQAVESAVTASSPSANASGLGVRGQVPADDLRPPAEHRPDRGPLLPALVVEQAADGLAEELRVIPAGPAADRTGPICPAGRARRRSHGGRAGLAGREQPGPFGLISGFIRPRPAADGRPADRPWPARPPWPQPAPRPPAGRGPPAPRRQR